MHVYYVRVPGLRKVVHRALAIIILAIQILFILKAIAIPVQWNLSITITLGPKISGCIKEVFAVWSFATWSLN